MIVRLGDVVCDPTWTETNQGMCSDSFGNILTAAGVPNSSAPAGACPAGFVMGPGVCIPANSPAALAPSLPGGGRPAAATILGLDPKTAAFIIGGGLIFFLVLRSGRL